MATVSSSDSQPIHGSPDAAFPMGAGNGMFAPPPGAAGNGIEEQTSQLSLLVEINAALAGAADAKSVLGPILTRLVERNRLSHAWIYRLDEPARELQRVAGRGTDGPGREIISLKEPTLVSWVVQQREVVYVARVDRDPRCQGFKSAAGCQYAVPLMTSSSILGVLDVASDQPDSIRAGTRKLIDQVATQAALALERSELYRRLRVAEERFGSIFEQGCFGVALAGLDGRFFTANPALRASWATPPRCYRESTSRKSPTQRTPRRARSACRRSSKAGRRKPHWRSGTCASRGMRFGARAMFPFCTMRLAGPPVS